MNVLIPNKKLRSSHVSGVELDLLLSLSIMALMDLTNKFRSSFIRIIGSLSPRVRLLSCHTFLDLHGELSMLELLVWMPCSTVNHFQISAVLNCILLLLSYQTVTNWHKFATQSAKPETKLMCKINNLKWWQFTHHNLYDPYIDTYTYDPWTDACHTHMILEQTHTIHIWSLNRHLYINP